MKISDVKFTVEFLRHQATKEQFERCKLETFSQKITSLFSVSSILLYIYFNLNLILALNKNFISGSKDDTE